MEGRWWRESPKDRPFVGEGERRGARAQTHPGRRRIARQPERADARVRALAPRGRNQGETRTLPRHRPPRRTGRREGPPARGAGVILRSPGVPVGGSPNHHQSIRESQRPSPARLSPSAKDAGHCHAGGSFRKGASHRGNCSPVDSSLSFHGRHGPIAKGWPFGVSSGPSRNVPLMEGLGEMVRAGGIEPPSQAWEAHIITTIRRPRS